MVSDNKLGDYRVHKKNRVEELCSVILMKFRHLERPAL